MLAAAVVLASLWAQAEQAPPPPAPAPAPVPAQAVAAPPPTPNRLRVYGLGYNFTDLISANSIAAEGPLRLDAYQCVWLAAKA